MQQLGFRAVSQATPLFASGLKPYRHPWGIWELPIYYMESMDMTFESNWPAGSHRCFDADVIERAVGEEGLFLFAFHPLHLALNTPSFARYQSVKPRVVEGGLSPFATAFAGPGARSFYERLVQRMQDCHLVSRSCSEALPE
jgi:hypothetical protein